jgi:hypothetical protein
MISMLDPRAARDVADAHHAATRRGGPADDAAYQRLTSEADQLFRAMTTGPAGVDVAFTRAEHPYDSVAELIRSVRRDRLLEVTSAARDRDRSHPVMGCELGGAYDRFRAVHDVLGHALLGVGFDREGEYATWRFQERFHSPLARRALATELHAEHSVRWTTGELPEHKAVLLDPRLVDRSRAGREGDAP